MSQSFEIKKVVSKKEFKLFIDFPYRLYKGHPHWVPPLRRSEIDTLSKSKNPAYDHCSAELFLALQGSKVVGRIACIINHEENKSIPQKVARFGWVDFIDDPSISKALFAAAESWALENDCQSLKGPYGFSNMDKAGLLIEGFEELSTMAVIYNYPYYPTHIENLGYCKLVDWKEFEATCPTEIPARVTKFAEMIKKRYKLHEVEPSRQELKTIGPEMFELLNVAYGDLEGFIPHSQRQIDLFVDQYLSLINPDFLSIIYDDKDKLVGFAVSMPSFSRALQKANGRLFPFGFLHLRKAMKVNDRVDLYLIAVRPDMQNKGVTALMFHKIISTVIKYNITRAETNPEQEHNQDVQNLWKGYDMRQHKRRRCYIKELT